MGPTGMMRRCDGSTLACRLAGRAINVSDRKGIETEEQVRSLVWSSYTEEEGEQEEVCLSVPSMGRGKASLGSDRIGCMSAHHCDSI